MTDQADVVAPEYDQVKKDVLASSFLRNNPQFLKLVDEVVIPLIEAAVDESGDDDETATELAELAAEFAECSKDMTEIAEGCFGFALSLAIAAGFADSEGNLTPDFPEPLRKLKDALQKHMAETKERISAALEDL